VNVLKLLLVALHEIIEDEDNNRDIKNPLEFKAS
jgi:hypothetical protein